MKSSNKVPEDTTNTEKGGDMEYHKECYQIVLANISKFMDTLHAVSEGCFISKGNLTMTVRYNQDDCEKQQIKELLDIILELTPGLVGIRRPDMAELESIIVNFREGVIHSEIEFG